MKYRARGRAQKGNIVTGSHKMAQRLRSQGRRVMLDKPAMVSGRAQKGGLRVRSLNMLDRMISQGRNVRLARPVSVSNRAGSKLRVRDYSLLQRLLKSGYRG
jgi:hypothetical protein